MVAIGEGIIYYPGDRLNIKTLSHKSMDSYYKIK